MDVSRFPMNLVVRYRLTASGMTVERLIIRVLAWLLFRGDEITWTLTRVKAYDMWMDGINFQKELDIPELICNNWITIWTSYNKAFGG